MSKKKTPPFVVTAISLAVLLTMTLFSWGLLQYLELRPLPPELADPGQAVFSGINYSLIWTPAPTGKHATHFVLQASIDSSFKTIDKNYGSTTQKKRDIPAPPLRSNATYYYRVKAGYQSQWFPTFVWSDWSNVVDLAVKHVSAPQLTPPNASVFSGEQYTLRWTSVSQADSYTMVVKENGKSKPDEFFPSSLSANTYTAPVVQKNTNYTYRIKATNKGNDVTLLSNISNVVLKTIPPPQADFDKKDIYSGETYTLKWAKPGGLTEFMVEESTDITFPIGSSNVFPNVSVDSKPFKHTVPKATTYYYRVRGIKNNIPYTLWSTPVSITVKTLAVPNVSVDKTQTYSGETYSVSWNSLTGATDYTLEEYKDGVLANTFKNITATSKTFNTGVKKKSDYAYRVKANRTGAQSGNWSSKSPVTVIVHSLALFKSTGATTSSKIDDPGGEIVVSATDSQNYLWVAHGSGSTIQKFTTNGTPLVGQSATVSSVISDMAIDSQNYIWVAYANTAKKFSSVAIPQAGQELTVASAINDIAIDTQDYLWVSYSTKAQKFTPVGKSLSGQQITAGGAIIKVTSDSQDYVWVASGNSIQKYTSIAKPLTGQQAILGGSVTSIVIDSQDYVWVAFGNTIKKFTSAGKPLSGQEATVGGPIANIAIDSQDYVWVAFGNTIKKFTSAGKPLSGQETTVGGPISTIAIDSQNRIWVGYTP